MSNPPDANNVSHSSSKLGVKDSSQRKEARCRVRVLHITTVHNPLDTRILYRECHSLAQAGYQVSLLACADLDASHGNVQTLSIPKAPNRIHRMTLTALAATIRAIRFNADIYHFHDPELAPWMVLLRILRKPVIFDVHENIFGSLSDRSWIPRILKRPITEVARFALHYLSGYSHVVFAERSYPQVYPWIKNFKVVCNFPAVDFLPAASKVKKFELFSAVYVGGLRRTRGLLDMLDAMRILQDSGDRIELYLVGRLDEKGLGSVESLIAERGLNNVRFLGYTPQPEAMKLVSQCHVGLAVLHSTPNYQESFPTKMFEYMGCGLPVIVSNFDLYRSVVEKWECGLTIPPADPAAMAGAIRQLASSPQETAQMSENGRRAVDNEYSWKTQAAVLIEQYDEISGIEDRGAHYV